MYYKANDIANHVIHFCNTHGYLISNFQLQKILYYVQLNFLKYLGYRAFEDDIEAWTYGPVIPNVNKIYEYTGIYILTNPSLNVLLTDSEQELFNEVVEKCVSISPSLLLEKSCCEKGPWYTIFHKEKGVKKIIPIDLMKNYVGLSFKNTH